MLARTGREVEEAEEIVSTTLTYVFASWRAMMLTSRLDLGFANGDRSSNLGSTRQAKTPSQITTAQGNITETQGRTRKLLTASPHKPIQLG